MSRAERQRPSLQARRLPRTRQPRPLATLARLAGAALLASPAAWAGAAAPAVGSAHPFAAPDLASGAAPAGFGSLGEVTVALGVVLAAIFGLAWLVRRVRAVAGRAEALAVLAEVRIGPKERAVLLKVGTAQLLVGVAPGQVNALHVLTQPVDVGSVSRPRVERPNFRALLMKSLGK
ncbi:MAG: flagellar biosynthetic protein FliO [Steroidobacteraceae bacterium]